jgi:hypothetical protein
MFIDGQWLAVPDDTIFYLVLPGDSGETAGGYWCGTTVDVDVGAVYLTRCAILPPRSAALWSFHKRPSANYPNDSLTPPGRISRSALGAMCEGRKWSRSRPVSLCTAPAAKEEKI